MTCELDPPVLVNYVGIMGSKRAGHYFDVFACKPKATDILNWLIEQDMDFEIIDPFCGDAINGLPGYGSDEEKWFWVNLFSEEEATLFRLTWAD